ncbi:hypothetical protein GE061_000647 [Apolygus lucorum]|uniref:Uncharacterized protein n=1 Tax=Apolygus lucorum TaxID=248454 RepID=A0A8S9Y4X9_APOLU|nr:hypothetical protein GE061_000647 [Apolygus lucorum]
MRPSRDLNYGNSHFGLSGFLIIVEYLDFAAQTTGKELKQCCRLLNLLVLAADSTRRATCCQSASASRHPNFKGKLMRVIQ